MAQRLVRAKNKIKNAAIPYEVPEGPQLDERLPAVLDVIYLIFNEGYAASDGAQAMRANLCEEAIRLGTILYQLMPLPEAGGLLALMLLHDSRRAARTTTDNPYIPLFDQDRSLWDGEKIEKGRTLLLHCLSQNRPGPFQIQAAISAVHGDAKRADETDWRQIAGLYAALYQHSPSPVVTINHAVAIANAGEIDHGLELLEALGSALDQYQPYFAALADLNARQGNKTQARAAYAKAVALSQNEAERDFLKGKLQRL